MSATAATTASFSTIPRRRVFVVAGVLVALFVFAGFARTYYLRPWLPARAIKPLVHAHGVLMSGWIALYVTQVWLIRRSRHTLHRCLGILGTILALAMVGVGTVVAARAIGRRFPGTQGARFLRIFVEFDGLSLWLFGALVLSGITLRTRPEFHRRLMLTATVSLLPPAFGRIAALWFHLQGGAHDLMAASATSVLALSCAVIDTREQRVWHPAMWWGAASVVIVNLLTCLTQVGD